MAVPYTFGNATTSIPLSQLDTNFATGITIGNTAVYLGNTTTSFGNVTLTNATISSGNATVTKITVPTVDAGSGNALTLQSNSTNALYIDASQNVGIGTSSPTRKFSVFDTTSIPVRIETNTSDTKIEIITTSGTQFVQGSANNLLFGTNNTERMRIDSSGNVGIGTSSPSSYGLLTVLSSTAGSAKISIQDTSGGASPAPLLQFGVNSSNGFNTSDAARVWTTSPSSTTASLNFAAYSGGAPSTAQMVLTGGNLLVGTTSADARLQTQSAGTTSATRAFRAINSASTELCAILSSGEFYTGTAGNSPYNSTTGSGANVFVASTGQLQRSTSSLKYKTDVKDATHGLAEVMQLRPVTYKGKNDGNTVFGGLIAEEVDAVGLTEFVQYAEDGSPDALAYGNMVSLLVKAIQEQQSIISDLQSRLAKAGL